jgi:hypothetical protein
MEEIIKKIDKEINERENKGFICAYNIEVEKGKAQNIGEIKGLELAKQIVLSNQPKDCVSCSEDYSLLANDFINVCEENERIKKQLSEQQKDKCYSQYDCEYKENGYCNLQGPCDHLIKPVTVGDKVIKRLTERGEQGNVFYPECFKRCDGVGCSSDCDSCDFSDAILYKLAAYEDTGLTPEDCASKWDMENECNIRDTEISSIKAELDAYHQAEEQGLLVKLPCKIGNTIYDIYESIENRNSPETIEYKAKTIEIGKDKHGIYFVIDNTILRTDDFGKTVFLTKEEAEAALKKGSGVE